jgi:dUTP diphosphatase
MPEISKHQPSSPKAQESPKKSKTSKEHQDETIPSPFKFQELKLLVKKNIESAQLPRRGSPHSAGYDLASSVEITVPPKGKALVDTGLSLSIPSGHYGRVAPRSGLAVKHFIDVGAGVIDCDYRGPLIVVLFNFGDEPFVLKPGDRIAQLIIEKIANPEVEEVFQLDDTVRSTGGFGSTGSN